MEFINKIQKISIIILLFIVLPLVLEGKFSAILFLIFILMAIKVVDYMNSKDNAIRN